MVAYSLDIGQIMRWSMPQLRLLARYRDIRQRAERRWQLALASGMMSQEAAEVLWAQLADDGDAEGGAYSVPAAPTGASGAAVDDSRRSHAVDSHGNVRASGASLLSDIALGKAVAPPLIPITVIGESKQKDEDA